MVSHAASLSLVLAVVLLLVTVTIKVSATAIGAQADIIVVTGLHRGADSDHEEGPTGGSNGDDNSYTPIDTPPIVTLTLVLIMTTHSADRDNAPSGLM